MISQDVLCLNKYLTSVTPEHDLEAFALHTPRHQPFIVTITLHMYYSTYQHLCKLAHGRKFLHEHTGRKESLNVQTLTL
jgi:hypothetical protein